MRLRKMRSSQPNDSESRPLIKSKSLAGVSGREAQDRSEEKYRILMENAPNPILATNPDSSIRYVNPAFEELTGFKKAEVIGTKSPYPWWPKEQIQDLIDAGVEGRKKQLNVLEFNYVKNNGDRFWVSASIKPVGRNGEVEFYLSNWVDITKSVQAQEALRESEERLRATVANAPIGIATSFPDKRFATANDAFCRILGYTEIELQKLTFKDITYPDDIKGSVFLLGELDSGRQPFFSHEKRYVRKDGSLIIGRVTVSLLRDQKGNPVTYVAELEDITERELAESKITDSERRYRLLAENVTDVIWKTKVEDPSRLTYVSPSISRLLGYTVEEAKEKTAEEVFTAESFECVSKALSEELAAEQIKRGEVGKSRMLELELKRKDGEVVPVEVNFNFIRGVDGQPVEILAVARDMTERKRAEEELREREAIYQNLFESMAQGVVYSDVEGNITSMNPAAENILGVRLADVQRENLTYSHWKYLREDGSQLPVEDHPALYSLRTGRAIKDVLVGTLDPRRQQYRWLNISAIPEYLPDVQNRPYRVFATFTDFTGRKEANDQLTQAQRDLQSSLFQVRSALEGSIEMVAKIVEMKDPYTAGHQQRVAKLSLAIAQEMQMPAGQIAYLGLAAKVHDIGKIRVPAEILTKTGKLTDLEFQMMMTHVPAGCDILSGVDFPWPLAQIISQHHERLDGSGYPDGLKADQICLEAKIIAVADTVEAMSNHRPYRPALGTEDALSQIQENKGKLFDDKVVEICVDLIKNKGFHF